MLLNITVPYATADQYYMGGYQPSGAVYTTTKVIFDCDFKNVDPSIISSSSNLIAGAWVNGGDGTTPGRYSYENPFFLYRTGQVKWIPQIWRTGTLVAYVGNINVGYNTYECYYGRMDMVIGEDKVYFKAFIYADELSLQRDTPTTYTYWHVIPLSEDNNFIAGTQTYDDIQFKHFQIGVESLYRVTQEWSVRIGHSGIWKDNAWKYYPCKSIRGDISFICYDPIADLVGRVGGLSYTGVNKQTSSADLVVWKYTGTTLPSYTVLWSQTGTIDQTQATPFS
jgi:hypothetical protein